jgi:hypothetical protein
MEGPPRGGDRATTTIVAMGRMQLAPVAQGLSDFEAKVVTARLGADGILWEVRGIVDGMYPLGGIDVLVPLDELETAQLSLRDQAEAAEAAFESYGPEPRAVGPGTAGSRRLWVTVAIMVGVAAFSATRMAAAVAWFQEGRHEDCTGSSAQAAVEGLNVRCRR